MPLDPSYPPERLSYMMADAQAPVIVTHTRLLDQLPDLSLVDANSALAELGRIDPKRWEAPGMLAGLNGDGRGYETATKFLEVALRNASEPSAKAGLENALRTAERELPPIAATILEPPSFIRRPGPRFLPDL